MDKQAPLPAPEILAILRAADDIIGSGGRTLLSRILKGSKEKKVLELGLDQNPSYGFFRAEKLENVIEKIDWMIHHHYLNIEYNWKLPVIIFAEKGWLIERDFRANEFLREWDRWLAEGKQEVDMTYLKDRNREMILLFLDKIRETADRTYIPYLEQWEKIDYRKVREAIRQVIHHLARGKLADLSDRDVRNEEINRALDAQPLQPEKIRCCECGKGFIFEVEEQVFFKMKGLTPPKRCPSCRKRRRLWK